MLGAGSCLLGHVPNASALPLAFIRHGGVRQIIGYATTTWYGRGGWDTLSKVMDEPGRHSLAEAAWLTQQDLVREVEARAPGIEINTTQLGSRDVVEFRAAVAEATGMSTTSAPLKELTGLLWDRDALVVIGDPAWDVRLNDGPRCWTLTRETGTMDGTERLTFKVTPEEDAPERTIAMLLPEELRGAELIDDGGGVVVLGDDFLLIAGVDDVLTLVLARKSVSSQ
jgi:zinc protease